MAVSRLCASFRQITISRRNFIARYCSSYSSKEQNNILPPSQLSNNLLSVNYAGTPIKFIPETLNIDFGIPLNGTKNNIIETPFKNISSVEEPLIRRPVQHDLPLVDKSLELPPTENTFEKLAIRILVIRRKKMKKHQRKKFRKRMQYVWAKLRQKRNLAKEKAFQAELIGQIKKAHMFDAKEYVNNKFIILDKEQIPKTYRGEILPSSMIKQFLEEKLQKQERKRNKIRLKLDETDM